MAMKLNDDLNATRGVTTFRIPLDKVIEKPGFNTRFGPPPSDKYERLKDMIRKDGQKVPAEVWVLEDKRVQLAAGHQRYQILKELQEEDGQPRTLLCIPFQGNEEKAIENSIDENLGQTGLSVMDNIVNWNRLVNVLGRSVADVAKKYLVSEATITQGIKLLSLDHKHLVMVHEGKLTMSMGLRLLKWPADKRDDILDLMFKTVEDRNKASKQALDQLQGPSVAPEAERLADEAPSANAEGLNEDQEAAVEPVIAVPPAPAAPAAGKKPAKAKAEPEAPRTRTSKKATETDLLRAAENIGVQSDEDPPRKMKELQNYFQGFLDETPDGPGRELVKDLRKFIARKLTDVQMSNRILKHTGQAIGEVVYDSKKGNGKK